MVQHAAINHGTISSGVIIKDDGTTVGTASVLNFTNGTVAFSNGTATVYGQFGTLDWIQRVDMTTNGYSATSTVANATSLGTAGDMFLLNFHATVFARGTAFDGTNFWTLTFDKITPANSATTVATITANSVTANNWVSYSTAINAVASGTAHPIFRIQATKTLSPGDIILGCTVSYLKV